MGSRDPRNGSTESKPNPIPAPAPVTPSLVTQQPAAAPMGVPGRNDEQRLDEALQETMPTSDPVSVHIE